MMNKNAIVTAKIPDQIYKEFALRIPEGERSRFIREAIMEKLEKTPRPDKIFELEKKFNKLETEVIMIKRYLSELEILTYGKNEVNPHTFCITEIDHKIIDYLIDHLGATTTELADYLGTNRWLILNRLKKIKRTSKKQLGKSIIEYLPEEKNGKRKAWWIRH